LLVLVAMLASPRQARAHRLDAKYDVLPGQKVQVEGWYDLTGDSAVGARVQVFRGADELVAEGKLNDQGLFVFEFARAEALRVVVDAGAGHRKELRLAAEALQQSPAADRKRPTLPRPTANGPPGDNNLPPQVNALPRADRSSQVSFKDVLIGVGFLLALAAFVLSLRNARHLRELRRLKSGADE
jgi:hypothetical protein